MGCCEGRAAGPLYPNAEAALSLCFVDTARCPLLTPRFSINRFHVNGYTQYKLFAHYKRDTHCKRHTVVYRYAAGVWNGVLVSVGCGVMDLKELVTDVVLCSEVIRKHRCTAFVNATAPQLMAVHLLNSKPHCPIGCAPRGEGGGGSVVRGAVCVHVCSL